MSSLTQLLSVGRSLVGLRDAPAPYRVVDRGLLPRLSLLVGARPSAGLPPAAAREGDLFCPAAEGHVRQPVGQPDRTRPDPASCPWAGEERLEPQVLPPDPRLALQEAKPAPGKGWFRPFLRQAAKPSGRRLVQGELALGNVRVVRNDLSDADLEVVEPKAGLGRPTATEAAAVATPTGAAGGSRLRRALSWFHVMTPERAALAPPAATGPGVGRLRVLG